MHRCSQQKFGSVAALPETNIFAPENAWLEDNPFLWDGLFSGSMLVLGSVTAIFGGWAKSSEHQLRREISIFRGKLLSVSGKVSPLCTVAYVYPMTITTDL